uniref:Endonuclease/exonuclease/phosphatase domain-containing protein n=1 Tax=Lepisosteus oculatus TaxID=7918 RepID=W5MGA4_LEPOC
ELANSLKERKVDIACVQETKWAGTKLREIGESYKLIYHASGSATARITDRLMSTKISMGTSTLHVVSCYAMQAGCPDEEKEKFWHYLETHVQAINDSEILSLSGDLNGHVGRAKNNFDRNHGRQGHGNCNEGGIQIVEHAEANTFFKKRESHLITYYSGGRTSQIDYWMVRRRDFKMVTDTKVIPCNSIAPQHRLLVLDAKVCLVQTPARPTTKFERIKWW